MHRVIVSWTRANRRFCIRSSHTDSSYFGFSPKIKQRSRISDKQIAFKRDNANLNALIEAYRLHGHRMASSDTIDRLQCYDSVPELDPSRYGMADNEEVLSIFEHVGFNERQVKTVSDLIRKLNETYCGSLRAEFSYIENECERDWLARNFEKLLEQKSLITEEQKKKLAIELLQFQEFDRFMNAKLPMVKRYGGEGSESSSVFFRQLLKLAANDDVNNIVIGMPHRGKLNCLVSIFKQRPAKIFYRYNGLRDDKEIIDVTKHCHFSADHEFENGKRVHSTILHSPSHLEAVNAVAMGKTRSKQQSLNDGAYSEDRYKEFGSHAINVLLHGDSAISGQGINQECSMMAYTPNFDIGGTIHLVINNQIGCTTSSENSRSSRHPTDIAKSINAPVIHVNSEDPELMLVVTKLAFDYQRKFRKDIFIDMICLRRLGHNELEDPSVSNPLMYQAIRKLKSVPDVYAEKMIKMGILCNEDLVRISRERFEYFNTELLASETYIPEKPEFSKQWKGFVQAPKELTTWDTGVEWNLLSNVGRASVHVPDDFNIHAQVNETFVKPRIKQIDEGKIDFATAEAMAIGSLMHDGFNVRLSGEDVGRGTFSQRHAMLIDQNTNKAFIPLNAIKGGFGGKFEVANSILSEEAVLGFEYGMSIDNPRNLIIWEAQYGDFFNGAQIIVDTYIASGESKWMISSGLVIILPHGYDGAASDHSSARMERWLQMTDSKETQPDGDDVNMHVIFPTTSAQLFHALRRQMIRNFRKPLVVFGPKTMFRMPEASSSYQDFLPGTQWRNVISDSSVANLSHIKKIIFCSGKHYYQLDKERIQKQHSNVAIVRLESLCPFPIDEIRDEIKKYENAETFIWSQEENRNMGAWNFIQPRFENMTNKKIKYCGRSEAGAPAVGVGNVHKEEADFVTSKPFSM